VRENPRDSSLGNDLDFSELSSTYSRIGEMLATRWAVTRIRTPVAPSRCTLEHVAEWCDLLKLVADLRLLAGRRPVGLQWPCSGRAGSPRSLWRHNRSVYCRRTAVNRDAPHWRHAGVPGDPLSRGDRQAHHLELVRQFKDTGR
jgi:hypothetical protein